MSGKLIALLTALCLLMGCCAGVSAETGDLVYGTATLTYAEYYSGDVSSTDAIDAVTSATTNKYSIMPNMSTDFVDETANAAGYHILGVQNVNVAVNAGDVEAYKTINATFAELETVPAQYKPVTIENGAAVYGATVLNTAAVITDATAQLQTATSWGDYQINITDGATVYLRTQRTDEGFAINSNLQGVIVETADGLKVGLEHLQNLWVQPYEISWNVSADSTANGHIAAQTNISEFAKLEGTTITSITYLMPDAAYVYEFEGIYVKPRFGSSFTASVTDGSLVFDAADFADFEDAVLTVTYTVGSGREAVRYTAYAGELLNGTASYTLDTTEISTLTEAGVYSAKITSSNYADVAVELSVPEA